MVEETVIWLEQENGFGGKVLNLTQTLLSTLASRPALPSLLFSTFQLQILDDCQAMFHCQGMSSLSWLGQGAYETSQWGRSWEMLGQGWWWEAERRPGVGSHLGVLGASLLKCVPALSKLLFCGEGPRHTGKATCLSDGENIKESDGGEGGVVRKGLIQEVMFEQT